MMFTANVNAVSSIDDLGELARRYKEHNSTFTWTLVVGLFFWPLLIIAYLEHTKMRDIRDRVAQLGVDIGWWQMTYGAK